MKRTLLGIGLAMAIATTACTKETSQGPVAAAPAAASTVTAPAAAAADAGGEALAWIQGSWCGGEEGEQIEETWTAPMADEAIGMSRTVRGGRILSFEFMRIVDRDGTSTFVAQPSGAAPSYFKRVDGGDGWIRFENKEHDFPQRIEYRKDGEGLLAQIAGPGEGGKEETISFQYSRCAK